MSTIDQISQLRETIRYILESSDRDIGAAGVVVVKKFDNDWKILGLVSSKQKHNGMYDLTKGMIDEGETSFEAAVRETQEESGIGPQDLNFRWGMISKPCNNVLLYVAETSAEPSISPNPETGKMEHTSADWLTVDEFENQCIEYLKPVCPWVRNILSQD